jgi:hypothetical protein
MGLLLNFIRILDSGQKGDHSIVESPNIQALDHETTLNIS